MYLYDVIGGGAARAVGAALASEDPSHSVLLVDAGSDYRESGSDPDDLVTASTIPSLTTIGEGYTPTSHGHTRRQPHGRRTAGASPKQLGQTFRMNQVPAPGLASATIR